MRKKLIFIGMTLLALVLTTGTFGYTYPGTTSATLGATMADEDMTTYEPSAEQPDWNDILPRGEYDFEYLLPSAAGDVTDLIPSDPTQQNWELVDDMPADDQATYVANNSRHYQTDLYNLTDYAQADGFETIQNITLYFRFAGDWRAKARAVIKTNGSIFTGDEESPDDEVYTTRSYQWEVNPATNEAWTWDEINALQAGVSLDAGRHSGPTTCTQVYIVVNYEFVITQGEVPGGDLYHITPNQDYTGDMLVKIYLMNTSNLLKAYQYLNMKLHVENSLEAEKTPDYLILSMETGVVLFNIEGGSADNYTVEVIGGSYRLISGEPNEWGQGWSIAPEFYCEVAQR